MTSRPVDDAMAVDQTTTDDSRSTDARAPSDIHLGERRIAVDYRRTAIAAGALGLGVLAYKGVSALLTRRSRVEGGLAETPAEPFPIDDGSRTAPAATSAAPTRQFVGEAPGSKDVTPFVAASTDDDTGDLLVEHRDSVAAGTTSADRSALTPEHVPTDLMGDTLPGAGERAIDAFRPDATAPVPPEMRESLRPATGPATGFAGNRGDFAQGLSQADGSK